MSEWQSCDGLSYAEVCVSLPLPPWPSMVGPEPDIGSSFMAEDARSLAALLVEAAAESDRLNEAVYG